jgi:hypothetical protein
MRSIDDPDHLRLRAAEMRSHADSAIYPETKQALLRIADDCDLLAMRAEKRLAAIANLRGNDLGQHEPTPIAPTLEGADVAKEMETETVVDADLPDSETLQADDENQHHADMQAR